MISHRADMFKRVLKEKRNQEWHDAWKAFTSAFGPHSKIFEYVFNDVDVDRHTYDGILQVEYSSTFNRGTGRSATDPGEPSSYEVAIHQVALLPGEIYNENNERIYDLGKLKDLAMPIYQAIGTDPICDYIEKKLLDDKDR
jgi:hypothetical protein